MPKVSVIIPNYNHAQFLEQRIESVLNQTFQDFEIIFLDDASTDNSKEVFSKYSSHPKISHVIFNETNSGSPFKQWNKGFGLSTGEYIWIAESDDYAEPTILEKLVQKLDAHPRVGLAYSQSWQVDKNGSILSTMDWWTDDLDICKWKNDYIVSGADECANYLVVKNTIPNASAVIFRHCFITELDSDIEKFKLCGDWLFWIKILLKCNIAFVAEPLNYFRTHENTARKLINLKVHILEKFNILTYLYQSVKIPDKIIYNIQSELIDSYVNCWYSEPLEYHEFVNLYKKFITINCKSSQFINIQINFFKKMLVIFRLKLALGTKIKKILGFKLDTK